MVAAPSRVPTRVPAPFRSFTLASPVPRRVVSGSLASAGASAGSPRARPRARGGGGGGRGAAQGETR